MERLKEEKSSLAGKLALVQDSTSAVSFHPAAVASFKSALGNLSAVLCTDGELPSAKLIRSVVDRVIVTPSDEKPKSRFQRRAMNVEIIGGLDALLSDAARHRFTTATVRDCVGSGGGT